MNLLGIDLGSSSVKVAIMKADTQEVIAAATTPEHEMGMHADQPGWAEQEPAEWWKHVISALKIIEKTQPGALKEVKGIGISYQMHGLVIVDKEGEVLRPSIIWCDSRAVSYGNKAFEEMGTEGTLSELLNSPGNFTASKLKWVKEHEQELFEKTYKFMLPGDWLAYKLSGNMATTVSGLSEGVLWNFKQGKPASTLLQYYGIPQNKMAQLVPNFGEQGKVSAEAAAETGLPQGTPIAYRAGDQPNNAFSLHVLNPGEVAATAGTSGVIYGIHDAVTYDEQSRVNTFVHVNHSEKDPRYGILACVNGTGITNSWTKALLNTKAGSEQIDYPEMNRLAQEAPIGADGLMVLPFGNGAERILENQDSSASFTGIQFNQHGPAHFLRATQEGIVFAMKYSMDIMRDMGMDYKKIRVGKANMFLSPLFREAFATVTGAELELYDTDGAAGAARGAGLGAGIYQNETEAFSGLNCLEKIKPVQEDVQAYANAYANWKKALKKHFSK